MEELEAIRQEYKKKGLERVTPRFQRWVLAFYEQHGRAYPWRETTDPYAVLVSEIMLQQTQVNRVKDKFVSFLQAFPDLASLANAGNAELLSRWQGLGYNRRALLLQRAAQEAIERYEGALPADAAELQKLPGIGPYTAAAVSAFAFNRDAVLMETNIRTLFIYIFLDTERETPFTDSEIQPFVEETRDTENPRRWYNALMDAGAYVKGRVGNLNRKSASYAKQGRFEGSNRQLRGMILRTLLQEEGLKKEELSERTGKETSDVEGIVAGLHKEGLLREKGGKYYLD